ncbi:nicotinate phosphoribosyltransferas-like protein [Coleophoma crateriformis]|uniref:nicotinate phosphoribosyltransferase n=1 Tax=Coleophoma crateriformis TaxID=565419 RepID=A0A3D8SM50_9HELO|nr:nicotinate phosphoribosyltransferas-like protein [Coleophoma crateriformis]
MDFNGSSPFPEGVISFLDTDLYKLTMQCAVLKYFPDVLVTYAFKNRTPEKKLSRVAFRWLEAQIRKLGNIALSNDELRFLQNTCTYLNQPYLNFLKDFRLNPRDQIVATFIPENGTGADGDIGDVDLVIKGLWVDTILYEIPLLALTSEAYFRFMDTDWTYDGQEEKAYDKGMRLLKAGCIVSEFGTRRRRDYHTQALVFRGLVQAKKAGEKEGLPGQISGTSNVHLAMRFGIPPVGTVAHEWFMGVAAITGNYEKATETALSYWVGCFGEGVLGIALTDTFGTPIFLRAFNQPIPRITSAASGSAATIASTDSTVNSATDGLSTTELPLGAPLKSTESPVKTFAQVFAGVRQDSGDPANFVKLMRDFYDKHGITDKKTIVFSDSLNIELCLEYKRIAEEQGFQPTFGVGTFLTNDFVQKSTGKKSVPLNIVIKLSSAAGNSAVKISDNIGKNTGDQETVDKVKRELGYQEMDWKGGDETTRWGTEDDTVKQA